MKTKLGIAAAFLVGASLLPSNARSLDLSGSSRYAVAEFSRTLTECAAFYGIMGQGRDHRGNEAEIFRKYQRLSERMSLDIMTEVSKVGIKPETFMSWFETFSKEMGKSMGYDAINVSIIINKYGEKCKYLLKNGEQEWGKVKNKYK
jgi:hypothetical protein